MKIDFAAPPTLWRFLCSDARVRAIVGPFGSAKSSTCVIEILRRASEQAPDAQKRRRTRCAVIRNTYGQLRDTTRKTFEQWVPEIIGHWKEQPFEFVIDRQLEDGTRMQCEVLFRALDRPQDVRKLLSLELTFAWINEGREVPKEILDGLTGRINRYPAKKDGGATWSGIWIDTNPWATSHWGYQLFSLDRPAGFELFEQPSGLSAEAENLRNLPTNYYQDLCAGKDDAWIDEYARGKYPNADKGSVFGDLLAKLKERGGVSEFSHPRDGVCVVFDLGYSDGTAMWFFRLDEGGLPSIIDWDEYSGAGLTENSGEKKGALPRLKERGYSYASIILPHDARAHSLQTGISTVELFSRDYPGIVTIAPELSLADGIGAARWLLEQPIRVHSRCAEGLARLGAYRYQWDEDKKIYKKVPLHNWASHTADSWRYLACSARPIRLALETPPPKKPQPRPVEGSYFQDDPEELFRRGAA